MDSGMPPLLDPMVLVPVQRAVSAHLGLPWTGDRLTDLADRSSHRAGVLEGFAFSVFVKLSHAVGAGAQFSAELAGLELIRDRARVLTPTPIGPGVIDVPGGAVLLLEASTAAVGPTSSSSGGFCLGSRGRRLRLLTAREHQRRRASGGKNCRVGWPRTRARAAAR